MLYKLTDGFNQYLEYPLLWKPVLPYLEAHNYLSAVCWLRILGTSVACPKPLQLLRSFLLCPSLCCQSQPHSVYFFSYFWDYGILQKSACRLTSLQGRLHFACHNRDVPAVWDTLVDYRRSSSRATLKYSNISKTAVLKQFFLCFVKWLMP